MTDPRAGVRDRLLVVDWQAGSDCFARELVRALSSRGIDSVVLTDPVHDMVEVARREEVRGGFFHVGHAGGNGGLAARNVASSLPEVIVMPYSRHSRGGEMASLLELREVLWSSKIPPARAAEIGASMCAVSRAESDLRRAREERPFTSAAHRISPCPLYEDGFLAGVAEGYLIEALADAGGVASEVYLSIRMSPATTSRRIAALAGRPRINGSRSERISRTRDGPCLLLYDPDDEARPTPGLLRLAHDLRATVRLLRGDEDVIAEADLVGARAVMLWAGSSRSPALGLVQAWRIARRRPDWALVVCSDDPDSELSEPGRSLGLGRRIALADSMEEAVRRLARPLLEVAGRRATLQSQKEPYLCSLPHRRFRIDLPDEIRELREGIEQVAVDWQANLSLAAATLMLTEDQLAKRRRRSRGGPPSGRFGSNLAVES